MEKKFDGNYEILNNYKELGNEVKELMQAAVEAVNSSYSPYSQFAIGVAIRLDDGKIIQGSNQENISFPAGLCAERVAIHTVFQDYPSSQIESMAIIGKSRGVWTREPITPCGICRQTMLEVILRQESSFSIYLGTETNETLYIPRAEYLMPLSFFHEDLKNSSSS